MTKESYEDPDELLEFKEINIRLTKEKYDEWSEWADSHVKTLLDYVKSCVESTALRELIINYLDERAKNTPWWEKKFHNL